jgi:hypothetical protein
MKQSASIPETASLIAKHALKPARHKGFFDRDLILRVVVNLVRVVLLHDL